MAYITTAVLSHEHPTGYTVLTPLFTFKRNFICYIARCHFIQLYLNNVFIFHSVPDMTDKCKVKENNFEC